MEETRAAESRPYITSDEKRNIYHRGTERRRTVKEKNNSDASAVHFSKFVQ